MWKYRFQYPNIRFIEGEPGAENEGGTDKPEENELTPEQMKESIAKLTRSLEASREDTKKAKSEAARVKDLEKQLEAANAEKLTEAEKAVAEARKEAAGEVTSKFTDRLISERVRSLAADQFAEPQDALMYLKNSGGFSSLTLNDEFEIDNDAVKKALEDVAKARPHWLKDATKTATAGQAGIGGGSNGGGKRAASLGEALQARYNKTSSK